MTLGVCHVEGQYVGRHREALLIDGRNLTGDGGEGEGGRGEGGRVGEKKTEWTRVGREEEEKDDDDSGTDNNNNNDRMTRLVSQLILH
jgi:hypothetical protein